MNPDFKIYLKTTSSPYIKKNELRYIQIIAHP